MTADRAGISGAPTSGVHPAARAGFARGAADYQRGRPGYPAALGQWLVDEVGLGPGCRAVDLGAGSGKFTGLLVGTGATVLAVEPVAEMLATLGEAVPAAIPLIGSATAIPIGSAAIDAVVCAQAFHWFATTAALDEMARVLRPGGRLALVWNQRDASVPWVARLEAIVNRHEGDAPRFYRGDWRAAFPHPAFAPLEVVEFAQAHVGSPDDVIVRRSLSTSFISALPAADRDAVEAELRALIEAEPALSGKAEVAVPYRTFAFCAQRLPSPAAGG